MASMSRLPLVLAILSLTCVGLGYSVGLAGVAKMAVLKNNNKPAGVPSTTPPEQNQIFSTSKFASPVYKDYYRKTLLVVTPVVSTVLYQEQEFSTVYNETFEAYETSYPKVLNSTTLVAVPKIQPTIRPSPVYDEFEWPTETQYYTTALNSTTTRVVENTIPFV